MDELDSQTKTEAVFNALRLALEDGQYMPGDWLRVNTLSDQLKVSPTPVREALRLLQSEGLVEHIPYRGVRVAMFEREAIEEVFRLRSMLEPFATELATERASRAQVAEIRRRHEELKEAVDSAEPRTDLAQLNEAFHLAIYSACESRLLIEFIRRSWVALPVKAGWRSREALSSVAQHEEIVEMIERRDARGAAALMSSHIRPLDRRLRDQFEDVTGA